MLARVAGSAVLIEKTDDHEVVEAVTVMLSRLEPSDAETLRLAYWEELTTRDLAVALACSPGAARVRLHRARKRAGAVLAAIHSLPVDETDNIQPMEVPQ